MASVSIGGPCHPKRTPVVTERMQEFKKRSHGGDVSTQKQHRCDTEGCEKAFTSRPGLKYHRKMNHSDTHQNFHCQMCHNSFKSANGLKYHTESKKAKCSEETGSPTPCLCCTEMEADTTTGHQSGVCDGETEGLVTQPDQSEVTGHLVTLPDQSEVTGHLDVGPSCFTDHRVTDHSSLQSLTKDFEKKVPPPLCIIEDAREVTKTGQWRPWVGRDVQKRSGMRRDVQKGSGMRRDVQKGSVMRRDVQEGSGMRHDIQEGSGMRRDVQEGSGMRRDIQEGSGMRRDVQEGSGMNLAVPEEGEVPPGELSVQTPSEIGTQMLTEFAIIATSSRSPLMQTGQPFPWDKPRESLESVTEEDTRHATGDVQWTGHHGNRGHVDGSHDTFSDSEVIQENRYGDHFGDDSDPRVTSSSPFPASNSADGDWSHKWPTAIWQCFIQGTVVSFVGGDGSWVSVEELARHEELSQQACRRGTCPRYAPNGLLLKDIQCWRDTTGHTTLTTCLLFSPEVNNQHELLVECKTDHPFFVKDKGWSSLDDTLTAQHYGIPCNELEEGDVCLPPSHPDAAFGTFHSGDSSSPSYTSAVSTLFTMAQQRNQRDQELSPTLGTGQAPRRKSVKSESLKPKRPMNGFMLFAKEHRLEYTHKYPGKDNRSISSVLGDKWKEMKTVEKNSYSEKAKVLAEQQKKIHPDCWKRKK